MMDREQVEFAYGLLWHMTFGFSDKNDRLASEARRALCFTIGKEGQSRGIQAAKNWVTSNYAKDGG